MALTLVSRYQIENVSGFEANILDAQMTGNLIANIPQRLLKVGFQCVAAVALETGTQRDRKSCFTLYTSSSSGNISGSSCLYISTQEGMGAIRS